MSPNREETSRQYYVFHCANLPINLHNPHSYQTHSHIAFPCARLSRNSGRVKSIHHPAELRSRDTKKRGSRRRVAERTRSHATNNRLHQRGRPLYRSNQCVVTPCHEATLHAAACVCTRCTRTLANLLLPKHKRCQTCASLNC